MNDDADHDSLLKFPCDFPIKIMGTHSADFVHSMVGIVQRHAPDFAADSVEIRASRGGKYLAVTCTFRAVSRDQLDKLYRELSAHPLVKIAL